MSGKSGKIHNLENLDDVHLKEILERRAFILQKPEFARLDDIVNEIVKRCAGSPLAAKAIGSMLRTKTSKEEWMVVSKKLVLWMLVVVTVIVVLAIYQIVSYLEQLM